MAAPLTIGFDASVRRQITQVGKRRRCTPSALVREAVTDLLERENSTVSFYDQIKDLIGVGERGGDPTLSENTGRKFTALLKARQAKRDTC